MRPAAIIERLKLKTPIYSKQQLTGTWEEHLKKEFYFYSERTRENNGT